MGEVRSRTRKRSDSVRDGFRMVANRAKGECNDGGDLRNLIQKTWELLIFAVFSGSCGLAGKGATPLPFWLPIGQR